MKKILLATDLEANSDRAIERALKIAKQQNAALYIIHVIPKYKSRPMGKMFKKQSEELIKAILADEFSHYKDLDITIEVIDSKEPYAKIIEYADKIKTDLIIMGLHGKAKFKDLFVGTTIERVIRKGRRPVLMVKNKALIPYDNIVSAIDFAPASRNALRLALSLFPKAKFDIIHTYITPIAYPMTAQYAIQIDDATEKTHRKAMTAFINTEESHFAKTNGIKIKLSSTIEQGDPLYCLSKFSKKKSADLITIGAHGKSIITPSKLGGLAHDILADPPCDILIVKE